MWSVNRLLTTYWLVRYYLLQRWFLHGLLNLRKGNSKNSCGILNFSWGSFETDSSWKLLGVQFMNSCRCCELVVVTSNSICYKLRWWACGFTTYHTWKSRGWRCGKGVIYYIPLFREGVDSLWQTRLALAWEVTRASLQDISHWFPQNIGIRGGRSGRRSHTSSFFLCHVDDLVASRSYVLACWSWTAGSSQKTPADWLTFHILTNGKDRKYLRNSFIAALQWRHTINRNYKEVEPKYKYHRYYMAAVSLQGRCQMWICNSPMVRPRPMCSPNQNNRSGQTIPHTHRSPLSSTTLRNLKPRHVMLPNKRDTPKGLDPTRVLVKRASCTQWLLPMAVRRRFIWTRRATMQELCSGTRYLEVGDTN